MKQLSLFFIWLTILTNQSFAQHISEKEENIYTFATLSPKPLLCDIQQYYLNELYYRDSLLTVKGRTIFQFVIEKNGELSNIKVMKGSTAYVDSLLVQILKESPTWKPGENLSPVRCRYTLPIDLNALQKISLDTFVYGKPDVSPQFNGNYEKFLKDSLRYPELALGAGIEGTVIMGFIVEKDGTTSQQCFLKSAGWGLEEETLRFFKSMPAWNPALKNGTPVRAYHKLSIQFRHPSH